MRHTYQSSSGGALVVPLERHSKIVGGTVTPLFAKMVSWKYAQLSAGQVSKDMSMNHGRPTSRCLIQRIGSEVGDLARATEFEIEYELPPMPAVVTHIAVSRDGTTTPIVKGGYQETMCGTISFYGAKGDRMHTIYAACAPQAGKATFDEVMDIELGKVLKRYPEVKYIGLADGAHNNWKYLEPRTQVYILDFYHAAERLSKVGHLMFTKEAARKKWLAEVCHDLKHRPKAAAFILRELKDFRNRSRPADTEGLDEHITYFQNNIKRMDYASYQKKGLPIGSGVTEAACKVVAKQRLNNSGMKWTIEPAQDILLIRSIVCTDGRWNQFWDNFDLKKAA